MNIRCKKCKRYLGEIRDARLHKDIVYLCKKCNTQREALELNYSNTPHESPMDQLFDIFNMKK